MVCLRGVLGVFGREGGFGWFGGVFEREGGFVWMG